MSRYFLSDDSISVGTIKYFVEMRNMASRLWEQRDSNPWPSACKADALNQLSYAPLFVSQRYVFFIYPTKKIINILVWIKFSDTVQNKPESTIIKKEVTEMASITSLIHLVGYKDLFYFLLYFTLSWKWLKNYFHWKLLFDYCLWIIRIKWLM